MSSSTETRPAPPPSHLLTSAASRVGDRLFAGLAQGAGIFVLALMAAIGAFLIMKALPAIQANTANVLTEPEWNPEASPPAFGIAALAWGTLVSSLIALVIAVPVAVGVALFISHYAPRRIAATLGYVVDLLAAVPSVVYGLWGAYWLVPRITPLHQWLNDKLGFIPFFSGTVTGARTLFTAGIVLAIMILPIVAAVSREVFLQVPRAHEEAALALGATRWEMIRIAVLPFSRPGVISAAMLGLGRALGETIAVAMVLSIGFNVSLRILEPNGITFASNIALKFSEAGDLGLSALIASGLVLFVITLLVNMSARLVIARRKEFTGAWV
ncbi:phosphate ABC transporter permease subunit PstC [Carbonactinospora thermoautotrophica]|uniref:phosphate ABC transporter permease subunit PstC n=1 Tax=Carbonactinospora thermoautotrophica TaxID=1469144 RepID=UPI002270EA43|nr:phosphate ABC transporter permease subunit PstC [Carbonactinospora thermoautotrophica]MCX9193263.1 phosphate ABC transporter permease subunit PstC [Carbonactinospora thermoautotrophica]